jgi:carboxyl-terminal processing protease
MTDNSLPTSPGGSGGRSCLLSLVAIVVVALVFAAGFGIGFGAGHFTATPASAAAASQGDDGNDLYPTFDIFWEAMDVLYRDFYGERPDAAAATYGAIRGVIGEFEDRNTSFMTPEEADFFRSDLQGSFEGIGARVDWDQTFDTLIVVEPFENQPAWNAGVKRDDLVVEVDGEEIIGTDLTSAVQKIRGPKGSTVKLTIMRQGGRGAAGDRDRARPHRDPDLDHRHGGRQPGLHPAQLVQRERGAIGAPGGERRARQ